MKGGWRGAGACLALGLFSAQAQTPLDVRIALVIGNAAYAHVARLDNAGKDAKSVAEALRSLGFQVEEVSDADQPRMRRAIDQVRQSLQGKQALGMLYYAGHGVQVDWRNYMLPVDIRASNTAEVQQQAVDVASVVETFKSAGTRMNILVLDACRDNPFGSAGVGKGLAPMDAPPGTFLAYATQPGNVAEDGDPQAANGPYAEFLTRELRKPFARVEDVFKRVRYQVRQKTQGRQIPWESTSLEEDFVFNDGSRVAVRAADLDRLAADARRREQELVQQASQARERERQIAQELERLRTAEEARRLEAERLAAMERQRETDRLAAQARQREEERQAAEARRREEERAAAEARRREEERQAAAEAQRREQERAAALEAKRLDAERAAAEAGRRQQQAAADAQRREQERLAAEAKRREEERLAAAARRAEEERLAADARRREEAALAERQRVAEEARRREAERLAREAQARERELAEQAARERERQQAAALALQQQREQEAQRARDAEQLRAELRAREELRLLSEAQRRERQFAEQKAEWDRIRDSRAADDLYAYLQKYPNGPVSELAQARLEHLDTPKIQPVADRSGQVQPFQARRFRLGDRYEFVVRDLLTRLEVERPVFHVTSADAETAEFNQGYRVTQAGAIIRTIAGATLDPYQQWIPAGEYQVGKRWSTRSILTPRGQAPMWVELQGRVVARETITVPAGTFDTYRMEMEQVAQDGTRLKITYWGQPDWGVAIKQIREIRDTRGALSGQVYEMVSRRRGG